MGGGGLGERDLALGHSWMASRHLPGERSNSTEQVPGMGTDLEPGSLLWGWTLHRAAPAVMTPTHHPLLKCWIIDFALEVSPFFLGHLSVKLLFGLLCLLAARPLMLVPWGDWLACEDRVRPRLGVERKHGKHHN